MNKSPIHCNRPGGDSRGFSLTELMVALVIALILMAGIGQIFLSSKKSFNVQSALGRQQENGRYAVNVITQDLRRAGYWGGNADITQITGTLGQASDDGSCAAGGNTWGRMIDRRIYGLNDTNAGYACIPDADYARGDVLVVRYAAPWQVGSSTTPEYDANRAYLRSSLFGGRIFLGSDQGSAANDMDLDLATPAPATERVAELVAQAYYIGPSGQTCRGSVVTSLFRESLNNSGLPRKGEIAHGVDNFQVRFGVDSDGDNAVNQYYDPQNVPNWGQVMAARIWLLTRAECPETGFSNTSTYAMADRNYTPNDAIRRQLYQATVRLRNK